MDLRRVGRQHELEALLRERVDDGRRRYALGADEVRYRPDAAVALLREERRPADAVARQGPHALVLLRRIRQRQEVREGPRDVAQLVRLEARHLRGHRLEARGRGVAVPDPTASRHRRAWCRGRSTIATSAASPCDVIWFPNSFPSFLTLRA